MEMIKVSKPKRVTRLAKRRNQSVEELIDGLIAEQKSVNKVARKLGVAPNAVRYHLEKLGYSFVDGEWRKAVRP